MKYKTGWTPQPKALADSSGFTLIELLIAVGIVAILAAIAIPSYTQHVVKSNRSEAKTILMQTAQALERCYTRFSAYNASACNVSFPINSASGHYQIAQPDDFSATDFTLVAVPQGTQGSRDGQTGSLTNPCGDFTLTHTGIRDVEVEKGDASADDCW